MNGHNSLLSLFSINLCGGTVQRGLLSQCRWQCIAGWVQKRRLGKKKQNSSSFYNFLLEKLERHCVLLSFVFVVYAVLHGKFPAHPGGEGIMTGLLSSEEEVRAESKQSLLDLPFIHCQHLLTLDVRVKMVGDFLLPQEGNSSHFNNQGTIKILSFNLKIS